MVESDLLPPIGWRQGQSGSGRKIGDTSSRMMHHVGHHHWGRAARSLPVKSCDHRGFSGLASHDGKGTFVFSYPNNQAFAPDGLLFSDRKK